MLAVSEKIFTKLFHEIINFLNLKNLNWKIFLVTTNPSDIIREMKQKNKNYICPEPPEQPGPSGESKKKGTLTVFT